MAHAKKELSDSAVGLASVIGFPSDDTPPSFTTEQKIQEAKNAVANGASELDMVMDYEHLKQAAQSSDDKQSSFYNAVYEDILAVRDAVLGITALKVIFETSQLTSEDVARASVICCLAGADFVKTSTGFREHGATVEVVQLMRTVCDVCQSEGLISKRVRVKASGGIRTMEDVRKMVSVGAERIGASAGVAIMNGLDKKDSTTKRDMAEATAAEY